MATVERTALTWDYAPAPESRDVDEPLAAAHFFSYAG